MKTYALSAIAILLVSCSTAQPKPAPAIDAPPAHNAGGESDTNARSTAGSAGDELAPYDEAVEIAEAEVTFSSGGDELKGSVLRPDGISERRPGVVLVHDLGPYSRDGLTEGGYGVKLPVAVPVYRSLAESLAERGFVVLSFDKRTCVEGAAPECSYPRTYIERDAIGSALVADVQAAAAALGARDDVASITFVGHGHGAEVALVAAAESDRAIEQVVMLAPSASSPAQRAVFQAERSVELLGAELEKLGDTSEADLLKRQLSKVTKVRDELKAGFAAIDTGESGGTIAGLSGATWKDYTAIHERYLNLLKSGEIAVFAVLPAINPGAPPGDAEALAVMLGADSGTFETVEGLSATMVEVGADDDATVVSDRAIELLLEIL